MRFASDQQDGEKAPFSICECVNLRVAPSARAANSLLLPLFRRGVPSRAWSRSSACLWLVRFQQASGTDFPTPHAAPSAQSDYRSLSEDHTRAGKSHQRQPLFSTCTMPLMTRRSFARYASVHLSASEVRPDSIAHRSAKTGSCARSRSPSKNESGSYCQTRKINEF
jgi:hypothetical protein